MSTKGLGYWTGGYWTTGYWTDGMWPQKHMTSPTTGLAAPTAVSRTSSVINDLDDGGGASGTLFEAIGTTPKPQTTDPDAMDETGNEE